MEQNIYFVGFYHATLNYLFSEYLEHGEYDVNVIGIDWGKLASHNDLPHYFIAANNAIKVGQHTGTLFANLLIKQLGLMPKNIHAIGHSLGAHVVGHFGRTIQSEGLGKISRVTGKGDY